MAATNNTQDEVEELEQMVRDIAHLLPSQAPIDYFVHHNTLHAFEDLPFEQALRQAQEVFDARSLMSEEEYHKAWESGRIQQEDLDAVLGISPEDTRKQAVGLGHFLDQPKLLERCLLQQQIRPVLPNTVNWFLLEQGELYAFPKDLKATTRALHERDFQHQLAELMGSSNNADIRNFLTGSSDETKSLQRLRSHYGINDFSIFAVQQHAQDSPGAFASIALWFQCLKLAETLCARKATATSDAKRHRDLAVALFHEDTDTYTHSILVRFYACYLDQGTAYWPMPQREQGLLKSFVALHSQGLRWRTGWLSHAIKALQQHLANDDTPQQILAANFERLGVKAPDQEEYLRSVLFSLRGWSGMIEFLEHRPDLCTVENCEPSLMQAAALHLTLEWAAWQETVQHHKPTWLELPWSALRQELPTEAPSELSEAYRLFQFCAHSGITARTLHIAPSEESNALAEKISQFDEFDRCWRWHLAYERHHRQEIASAVQQNATLQSKETDATPLYQLACCIDDREESLRRHIEEVDPRCETFGVVGFFGLDMNYQGLRDAHPRPLCPANIRPDHIVYEKPRDQHEVLARAERSRHRRQWMGLLFWHGFVGSRTIFRGFLWTLLGGFLSIFPMAMRIFFQRKASQFEDRLKEYLAPYPESETYIAVIQEEQDASSTAHNHDNHDDHGHGDQQSGFTREELAQRGAQILQFMGMTQRFADLVLIMGHGSCSLNNPHEAAHDCGACGGGRGGPNARGFALALNDPEVRALIASKHGVEIPERTYFLGCFHNTASGGIDFFDTISIPDTHQSLFARAEANLREAQRRDSHERARRFSSMPLSATSDQALFHAEGRAFDLSEPRPEYGHATNAICIVGKRHTTRNLFLDRRVFLISYDHTQDPDQAVLGPLLNSAGPVCAGINLEYFFSFVDNEFHGCGTKLPHNVTSLLGVMNGHISDLRTGLPWQMVEIHEPVRLLLIVECSKDAMQRVFDTQPAFAQLAKNRWIQLVLLDPETLIMSFYAEDGIVEIDAMEQSLPQVPHSLSWYNGKRDHLPPARIVASSTSTMQLES